LTKLIRYNLACGDLCHQLINFHGFATDEATALANGDMSARA